MFVLGSGMLPKAADCNNVQYPNINGKLTFQVKIGMDLGPLLAFSDA